LTVAGRRRESRLRSFAGGGAQNGMSPRVLGRQA